MKDFSLYKGISGFIFRVLCVLVIFLFLAILCKKDIVYKDYIHNKIYNSNISFSYFKNIYNRYLGGVFPDYQFDNTTKVFNEKIRYSSVVDYYDGVKLTVGNNYLVPLIKEGIVVYIGEKDNYGNVVLVEDSDGVDTWYGNVCDISVNLYDNLSAGSYIGQSCGDYIYLVYSKGNVFLDYKDYFE